MTDSKRNIKKCKFLGEKPSPRPQYRSYDKLTRIAFCSACRKDSKSILRFAIAMIFSLKNAFLNEINPSQALNIDPRPN